MKIYLGGGAGIKNPKDALGNPINIGDKLSWDFHAPHYKEKGVKDWMRKAIFVVEQHQSGKCLCAKGIHKPLYLHDFRFEYCEIVINEIENK